MSQRDDDMVVDFAIAPHNAAEYYGTKPDDVLFEADVQVTSAIMDILSVGEFPQLSVVPDHLWEHVDDAVGALGVGVAELSPQVVAGLAVAHTLQSRRGPHTGALPVIPAPGEAQSVGIGGAHVHRQAPAVYGTPLASPLGGNDPDAGEADTGTVHTDVSQSDASVPGALQVRGRAGRVAALTIAFAVVGVAAGLAVGLWGSRTVLSPIAHQNTAVPTVESSLVPQSMPLAPDAMPVGHGVDLVAPGTDAVAGRVDTAAGDGQVLFRVSVKAVPPAGSYLEAWLMRPDSTARVSLGVLLPGRPTVVRAPASLWGAGLTVVDVSQEPIDNQPAFSGLSVARGLVTPAPVEPPPAK